MRQVTKKGEAMLDIYLEVLDEGYFEVKEAFKGMADAHAWKRPAETLLSAGEIAGHVAYWQAVKFAGGIAVPDPDLSKCPIKSLLIDPRFRYYTTTLDTSPSPEQLAMTASEVCAELVRVHTESVAHLRALNPDLDSRPPGCPPHYTYRWFLKYAIFHVAYHTGQIYSARHLLGEQPPDN
jgi:hypothetical protein